MRLLFFCFFVFSSLLVFSEDDKNEKFIEELDNMKLEYKELKEKNKLLKEKKQYKSKVSKLKSENELIKLETDCYDETSKTNNISCDKLGSIYLKEKKESKAKKVWEIACNRNHPNGCYNLGVSFQQSRNYKKAQTYFFKGCELNMADSCNNLGFVEYKMKNINGTRTYFEKACSLKLQQACSNLAKLELGHKEYDKAKRFFQKACFLGDKLSCNKVINLDNEIKNEQLKVFESKCKNNSVVDCYNKGYVLFTMNKKEEAKGAFATACDMGDVLSCGYLGTIMKNNELINAVVNKLVPNCLKGESENCFQLSCLYGLVGDKVKSLHYLDKSISTGMKDWNRIDSSFELKEIRKTNEYKSLKSKNSK